MNRKAIKDLQSTVNDVGTYVTQIIHFVDGTKRTFTGIKSDTIKQGQFTKFWLKNGSMLFINDEKVLCIEVFSEDELG
jgi:predicted transcriptional regulator